jgi:ankyrin repeat protein
MLAVAGGGQNTECVRLLHSAKADLTVSDPVGNNLFHLAVRNSNLPALEYLLKNWPSSVPLDLGERNKKGETPFSIATELKNESALKQLSEYEEQFGD